MKMTERLWLSGTEPVEMINHLGRRRSRRPTHRKLRLFSTEGYRQLCRAVDEHPDQRVLDAAEGYADGLITAEELGDVRRQLKLEWDRRARNGYLLKLDEVADYACWMDFETEGTGYVVSAANVAKTAPRMAGTRPWEHWRSCERDPGFCRLLSDLARDIFGNPYQPQPSLDPAWLGWHDGLVPATAQTMYDTREFGDTAVLADMLEDAGCDDPRILSHLRGPGQHVRGCHVIDLILGKAPYLVWRVTNEQVTNDPIPA